MEAFVYTSYLSPPTLNLIENPGGLLLSPLNLGSLFAQHAIGCNPSQETLTSEYKRLSTTSRNRLTRLISPAAQDDSVLPTKFDDDTLPHGAEGVPVRSCIQSKFATGHLVK